MANRKAYVMKYPVEDDESYIVVAEEGSENEDTLYLRRDGSVSPAVEDDETDGYFDSEEEAKTALAIWL